MDSIFKDYSDVIIVVDNKRYNLHKIILSQISFFKNLLSDKYGDVKDNIITLTDNVFTVDSFETLISQLYNNVLEKSKQFRYDLPNIESINLALFLNMTDDVERAINIMYALIDKNVEDYKIRVIRDDYPKIIKTKDDIYYGSFDVKVLETYLLFTRDEKIPWVTSVLESFLSFFEYKLLSYPLSRLLLYALRFKMKKSLPNEDLSQIYDEYYAKDDDALDSNRNILYQYVQTYIDL